MYETHILNKSGRQSEAFEGEEIAKASSRDTNSKTKVEWDAVRVFEKDPVWARKREKEILEENGKEVIITPYVVGIMKGDLYEYGSNRYKTDHIDDVGEILALIMKKLPVLHGEIKEQLSTYEAPQAVLEYVAYVKEKRERRRNPVVT